jgi:hypothetical protein
MRLRLALSVLGLAAGCAAWVVVALLARRVLA